MSTASLWVDNPASAQSSLGNQDPAMLPPAQQEQNVVMELLTTRDFALAVGRNSSLGHYLATHTSPGGFGPSALLSRLSGAGTLESRIMDALGSGSVTTAVPGPQVLQINYSGPTPGVAQSTLQAIISELQKASLRFSQARDREAVSYYQGQSQAASKAVASARAQASSYLAQHPNAGSGDPNLTALQTAQSNASTQLTQANQNLTTALTALTRGSAGSSVHVIDAADTPTGPVSGKKQMLLAIVGGLFAGALISFLGLVALTPGKPPQSDDELALVLASVDSATGPRLAVTHEAGSEEEDAESGSGQRRFLRASATSRGNQTVQ
jgi:uncharacterized protein involved in exopolysaccharide biosynthesis